MTTTPRRAGQRGPRWLILTSALFVTTALSGYPQERPKQDEFSRFDTYKQGSIPVGDAGSKEILEKVARYFADRLSYADVQNKGGMSQLIQDANRRLHLPPPHLYHARVNAAQKKFVDEYG